MSKKNKISLWIVSIGFSLILASSFCPYLWGKVLGIFGGVCLLGVGSMFFVVKPAGYYARMNKKKEDDNE